VPAGLQRGHDLRHELLHLLGLDRQHQDLAGLHRRHVVRPDLHATVHQVRQLRYLPARDVDVVGIQRAGVEPALGQGTAEIPATEDGDGGEGGKGHGLLRCRVRRKSEGGGWREETTPVKRRQRCPGRRYAPSRSFPSFPA